MCFHWMNAAHFQEFGDLQELLNIYKNIYEHIIVESFIVSKTLKSDYPLMLSIPETKIHKIQNDKVFFYRYIFKGIRCAVFYKKNKHTIYEKH